MIKTADIPKSKIQNNHKSAVYFAAVLGLIMLLFIAFLGSSGCSSAQITSKRQVLNKYYYQLSDGSGAWSDQDFSINDRVCVSYPTSALAQK